MKKFRLQAVAMFLFTAAAALTSCSSDDNASTPAPVSKTAFVTAVTGPATGTPNQELSLNVTFTVDNSCGAFDKVVETADGNTKTIEVKAAYAGSNCGTTPTTKNTVYKFKPAAAGTYVLKFKKSATEFITQNIVVSAN